MTLKRLQISSTVELRWSASLTLFESQTLFSQLLKLCEITFVIASSSSFLLSLLLENRAVFCFGFGNHAFLRFRVISPTTNSSWDVFLPLGTCSCLVRLTGTIPGVLAWSLHLPDGLHPMVRESHLPFPNTNQFSSWAAYPDVVQLVARRGRPGSGLCPQRYYLTQAPCTHWPSYSAVNCNIWFFI